MSTAPVTPDPHQHFKRASRLASLLTQYDQKQSTKRGWNPYGLGHYMGSVESWENDPKAIAEPVKTLGKYFTANPAEPEDYCLAPVRQFVRELRAGRI